MDIHKYLEDVSQYDKNEVAFVVHQNGECAVVRHGTQHIFKTTEEAEEWLKKQWEDIINSQLGF